MKTEYKNIIFIVLVSVVAVLVFVFAFLNSLGKGECVPEAIFSASFVVLLVFAMIVFSVIIWWRLFTSEGREAEEEARALDEIKKIERKRDREWRKMNR